jgi:hypothetical protein
MDDPWQYQLRITVSAELAASLRGDPSSGTYVPLGEVLRKHHASLKCQFDAFADYVQGHHREAGEEGPIPAVLHAIRRRRRGL